MNPCESCAIADKIFECCGRFPDTGQSVDYILEDNVTLSACPHLNREGRCGIYTHRPLNCQNHMCDGRLF